MKTMALTAAIGILVVTLSGCGGGSSATKPKAPAEEMPAAGQPPAEEMPKAPAEEMPAAGQPPAEMPEAPEMPGPIFQVVGREADLYPDLPDSDDNVVKINRGRVTNLRMTDLVLRVVGEERRDSGGTNDNRLYSCLGNQACIDADGDSPKTKEAAGAEMWTRSFRQGVVCPGGTRCRSRNATFDDRRTVPIPEILSQTEAEKYSLRKTGFDHSIKWHADVFDFFTHRLVRTLQDVGLWTGDIGLEGRSWAGVMDDAVFYVASSEITDEPTREHAWTRGFFERSFAAAFGEKHSGYPVRSDVLGLDRAVWKGAMVGFERMPTVPSAINDRTNREALRRLTGDSNPLGLDQLPIPIVFVDGKAELTYDFSSNTVDLEITDIVSRNEEVGDDPSLRPARQLNPDYLYTGPRALAWDDLRVNSDGSFRIPGYGNDKAGTGLHPELGYVEGDFYGAGGKEFAGVFESKPYTVGPLPGWSLIGAFGGKRQTGE